MQNPRCDKCGDEAKVREGILLLCSHCWLNQYMKLSRKETQRYGNSRNIFSDYSEFQSDLKHDWHVNDV